jgi:hypothetical protein
MEFSASDRGSIIDFGISKFLKKLVPVDKQLAMASKVEQLLKQNLSIELC